MTAARYADLTRRYYETYLPSEVAKLPDPESFYRGQGKRMAERMRDLAATFAGNDPADEGYLDKVGRLGTAQKQAEEMVLGEDLFSLTKEPGTEDAELPMGHVPGATRVE